MKLSPARRNDVLAAALGLIVVLVDQLTKHWIVAYFGMPGQRPPIALVGQILQLDYTQNTGVAFSLLAGQAVLFVFIAVAIAVIGSLYWRLREVGSLAIKMTFGLILGGALGNLIDRFRQAYVVDFIHFQIPGRFNFAVFNVADSAISVGVVVLAFLLWRGGAEETKAGAQGKVEATGEGQPSAEGSGSAPRVRNPHARSK